MTIKPPVEDFATDWDHTDPQWVSNPYPIWEDLRERCPVAHTNVLAVAGSPRLTRASPPSRRTR